MKLKISLFYILILGSLCFPHSVSGQNILSTGKQETQERPDTVIVQIQPIPVTDITFASTEAFNLVIESGKEHLTEEEIKNFTEQSDTIFSVIDIFLNDSSLQSFEGFSSRELENNLLKARIYGDQLADIQNELSKRSKQSEGVVEELVLAKKRWQLTLERSTEDEIPEALLGKINMIIISIDSVRTVLQGDIEILLIQLDNLSSKRNKLVSLQERINDQKLSLGETLFIRNMPGFFEDLSNLKDSTLIQGHIIRLNRRVKSDVEIFNSQFRAPLIFVTFISILLLIFSLWFKKNYSRMISVRNFELSEIHLQIINAPILVVLFVTTFMIRFTFSDLSFTFLAFNSVVFIIAILIIAMRLFASSVKPWVQWLMVIYLIIVFYELIFYPDIILRIILLIISLTGFGLFLWMILKKPFAGRLKSKFVYNLLHTILAGFTILLGIAIIANLLGAFSLAEFFTLAPISIVILAIAIHISTKVLDTIVFLLLASKSVQRVNVLKEEFSAIYTKTVRLINLFLWIFFTVTTFNILRIKDPIFEWGRNALTEGWEIGEVNISLGSILIFVFVIWLSIFISKAVRHILEKDVFVRVSTSKGMPSTIIMLVRIGVITGGFFLAAKVAGMNLTNLSIILGAFSVGIGFGLQNIFNNMVSGLILAFERPIKVGDTIQVGELMGVVLSIGFRASTIKSFDGAEVILPNGNLISNQMINWTLSDSFRRMDIRLGVAYGTDPDQVIEIMKKTAGEHARVSKVPAPSAFFLGFGESSLDFRLLAWTDIGHRLTVESELYLSVNKKLTEAGIEIPFPQTDLHIRSDFREKS